MSKISMKSPSIDERMRQNWIHELKDLGIHEGPKGEPLQNLSTHELRGLILKEHLKRD